MISLLEKWLLSRCRGRDFSLSLAGEVALHEAVRRTVEQGNLSNRSLPMRLPNTKWGPQCVVMVWSVWSVHTGCSGKGLCWQREFTVARVTASALFLVTLWFFPRELSVLSRRETDLALVWWQFSSLFVSPTRDALPGGPYWGILHNRPAVKNGYWGLSRSCICDSWSDWCSVTTTKKPEEDVSSHSNILPPSLGIGFLTEPGARLASIHPRRTSCFSASHSAVLYLATYSHI